MHNYVFGDDVKDCVEFSLARFCVANDMLEAQRYMQAVSNLYYAVYNMCRAFILFHQSLSQSEDQHKRLPHIYASLYNTTSTFAIDETLKDEKTCIDTIREWHTQRILVDYRIYRNNMGSNNLHSLAPMMFYDKKDLENIFNSIKPMANFINKHIEFLNDKFNTNYIICNVKLPTDLSSEEMYRLDKRSIIQPNNEQNHN